MELQSHSRSHARQAAANTLELMIAGQLGLIEGARQIVDMRHSLFGHSANDPDFDRLFELESHTNHLPIGREREEWDPVALAEKDREIAAVEAEAREEVLSACRGLLSTFRAA
jgi:hypothetical protein